ncbi:His-Xaa-Ser repeat protein HxsA [Sphingomonas sp. 3P27F8]|jgi:His-Xaa-Ser repeat protein HxsA|nr:His-Xaa-Ser repeat protein HxsA [Sphingomonas sp. 3P27F8]
MKKRRFMISSLLMAGIAPLPPLHAQDLSVAPPGGGPDPDDGQWVQRFAQDHGFLLAQHRSHSSHASHSSHRSGSSGTYRAPVYTPRAPSRPRTTPPSSSTRSESRNTRSTPDSSVLPSSPAITDNPFSAYTPPSTATIQSVVRRVQIGLQAQGYYHGALDGVVGKETRAALVRFQTDKSLPVTGTITPEVLDALRIPAQ